MPDVRFKKGGSYSSDIQKIRSLIRQNGSLNNIATITVSHDKLPGTTVNLFMNLAFQPNSHYPVPNASLYIVAFQNALNTYQFDIVPAVPGTPAGVLLDQDGSYGSFGHNNDLPSISDHTLQQALTAVNGYDGGLPNQNVLNGLARLVIAVAEAVRFDEVCDGVEKAVSKDDTYNPPYNTIHNWGGRFIGK